MHTSIASPSSALKPIEPSAPTHNSTKLKVAMSWTRLPLFIRALILSLAVLAVFLFGWEMTVRSMGGEAPPDMDPEYAALLGATAMGESAMPGPLAVGKNCGGTSRTIL